MSSVVRRLKRNILAATLAAKVGVRTPPAIGKLSKPTAVVNAAGTSTRVITERTLHSKYTAQITYRTLMLRLARHMREKLKAQHVIEQAKSGRRKRLDAFFGHKSWVRRVLEWFFPGLIKDVKQEAKAERLKLRDQRKHKTLSTFERTGR